MTTIVCREELVPGSSPGSSRRNVQNFKVTVMEGGSSSGSGGLGVGGAVANPLGIRGGSPKHPHKKYSVRNRTQGVKAVNQRKTSHQVELRSHFSGSYNPQRLTITAYLEHDGGRRLKVGREREPAVAPLFRGLGTATKRAGIFAHAFPFLLALFSFLLPFSISLSYANPHMRMNIPLRTRLLYCSCEPCYGLLCTCIIPCFCKVLRILACRFR